MLVRKAVIPAGGLGTRFLPATKAQPKEMLPIIDRPTIQYVVEEAVNSGIEDIIIVTGRHKRAIEDHFDRSVELEQALKEQAKYELAATLEELAELPNIHYIRQKETLGLGHAVHCARKFVGNEPFAVMLGDDIVTGKTPCLKQMINVFEVNRKSIVAVQQTPQEELRRYGVIQPGRLTNNNAPNVVPVDDLVEKPSPDEAPSNLAVIGRYILTPRAFDILEQLPPGKGHEIQLTDALRVLAREEGLLAYTFTGKRFDIGDKLGYLRATVEFALERADLADSFRSFLSRILMDGPSST